MLFEKYYKNFSKPLYKFIAKRMGSDQRVTEEIFEETAVAAWRGFKTFKHKSSYFTWLCRIALNKIADYYRAQIHHKSSIVVPLIDIITQSDTKTLSPDEALSLKELRKSVNDCLNLLPPGKRQLLQLRYWEDLSYEKIAKLTGLSIRAVEGKLYRARHEFGLIWNTNFK